PDGDVAGEILVALVVAVEQRVAAGGKIEMSGLVRQERHVAQERQRLIVGTGSTRPCHRQVQQQEYSTGPHDILPTSTVVCESGSRIADRIQRKDSPNPAVPVTACDRRCVSGWRRTRPWPGRRSRRVCGRARGREGSDPAARAPRPRSASASRCAGRWWTACV